MEGLDSPVFDIITFSSSNSSASSIDDALSQTTDTNIIMQGFYEKDDVEYGPLQYFATSTLQHDGGLVIDPAAPSPTLGLNAYLSYVSTSPGRWIRKAGDRIPVEWYGAKKNDEGFDNILPITKAMESPHTKGKEIIFTKGFYVINSTLLINVSGVTISGSGKYDTFIVGYKSGIAGGAISPIVRVNPGADNTTIKNIGMKPWNYPSRHEAGWTDRFKLTGEGRIQYADNVKTINRNINRGDPDFFELDLTDSATQELFPPHWYTTSFNTKTGLYCGGILTSSSNAFKAYFRTITIAPSQTADIVDTFTAADLPQGFDMDNWNLNVRIVQTGSSQKGGLTYPASNSSAMLPTEFGTPAVEVDITADAVYNYDGTFTITFKFGSTVSSDFSGLASSNISGGNYIMPYAVDLYRSIVNLEIDNVFIDGMWYTGPVGTESGITNKIGIEDMVTLFAVKNVKITNSNFENYANDGISMKDVFDSWGPSIQTRSINNNLLVKSTQFRRGGKSGVDIEGNNIVMENCKLIDVINLGALRFGSRAYGVLQNKYLFKNCDCSLDPKGSTTSGVSIRRFLGSSGVKKVVFDSCTFFIPPYVSLPVRVIGILMISYNSGIVIIKNCTFNAIFRSVQINGIIDAISIIDCRSINTGSADGSIVFVGSTSILRGPISISGYYFERQLGVVNRIIGGGATTGVDKNSLVRCDVVLSETSALQRSLISYSMFRTFFNNMNSVNRNIIEHAIIDDPWSVTVVLGSNLSGSSVDSSSRKYKFIGKNVEVFLKITANVIASGTDSSFTFTLPMAVSSGAPNIYGTCTAINASSAQSVGAVLYGSSSTGRVKIIPSGTGSTTFWINCEYEF